VKVVVFGATGVIGRAALVHFSQLPDCDVIGASRRATDVDGVTYVPLDLLDRRACQRAARAMVGATHVVYAALQESDDLTAGWRDRALMERNLTMFSNALEPVLDAAAETLAHVSLLQGAKAYGLHVGRTIAPAKERAPRDDHDNFYFLQEDRLRELATDARWSWTILRPQVVYGQSFGSPMNLVPVIGVYGALLRARGLPLAFPGGPPHIQEAIDARLLARALAWSATAPSAR
jgi:nucleoside-diphosphate-sugar epimerase